MSRPVALIDAESFRVSREDGEGCGWFVDGFYSERWMAVEMAEFYVEKGAKVARIGRHPDPGWGWGILYSASAPWVSWHDQYEMRIVHHLDLHGRTFVAGDVDDNHPLHNHAVRKRCSECGRPLSDPLSIAAGHGPTCSRLVLADSK